MPRVTLGILVGLGLALIGGLTVTGALAEETVMNHVVLDQAARTQAQDILVGNEVVARVRVAAAGYSVPERAQIVQSRIRTILSDTSFTRDTIARAVSVRKLGADRAIYVGDHLFFTITPADGRATQATPEQLARMWSDNLRAALPKVAPFPEPEAMGG
jgi:riboflavin biosynthesis pyrimidine reductase